MSKFEFGLNVVLGRCLWVAKMEPRVEAGKVGLGDGFFITFESRGGVGVRVRSKIIVRSGLSLGLGLSWGLISRKFSFSCWNRILSD